MDGRNAALIARFHPRYRSPKRAYEAALDRWVQPGAAWLDVGCGRALSGDPDLNTRLSQRAALVVGCDRDPHLQRHATTRLLAQCDAADLPFESGTFDLVTASMVAEHLKDPARVFAEVARVSKPDGTFIVCTPNRYNYAMLAAQATPYAFHVFSKRLMYFLNRGKWESFEDDVFPTYYRANTARRLRDLMLGAGFEDVRIERLAMAHSFGFVAPLYAASLLFERIIDRRPLDVLKADLLAIGSKRAGAAKVIAISKISPLARGAGLAVGEAAFAREARRATV